jgi:hypothetical protein
MDHEVLDFPRMIAKVERMNMRQENPEEDQETKTMEEPQKESENVLLQMKETLNDHININLSEIFKEKECIETRIGDFDIDFVLDEGNTGEYHDRKNLGNFRKACYDSFIRRNRII